MAGTTRDDATAHVASCTILAAHRRDHQHDSGSDGCRPHAVEVVHLGGRAVMVCHDCSTDTGFLPHREAEEQARRHRSHTRVDHGDPPAAATTQHPARPAA